MIDMFFKFVFLNSYYKKERRKKRVRDFVFEECVRFI